MSDFECTYSIGKALVLPAVTRRYENSNGLQIKIINNMRRFLGIKKVLGRPEPDNFIVHWKMFQMCGVYCRNSTLQEKKRWRTSWGRNDRSVWSLSASSTKSRFNSFVQIAKSETFLAHCIHMLDLLEKNIMTSSKWQLLPYFIVYLFHRSFEKSRKNNPMFEDFGFIFFFSKI